jgi:hypothetical protein
MPLLRNLTRLGFFLVLYSLLFINRKRTYEPKFDELAVVLERNTSFIKAEITNWEKAAQKQLKAPYRKEALKSYEQKFKIVASEGEEIDAYFESLKKKSDWLIQNKLSKKQLTAFCRKNGIDTLSKMLDGYRGLLIEQLTEYHEGYFPYRKDYLEKLSPKHWSDSQLLRRLSSAEELKAVLCVFQNDALFVRLFAITELAREISPGCILRFDNFMTVAFPQTPFQFPGQKVRAKMILAEFHNALNPVTIVDKGSIIRTENGIATWSCKNSPLGLNTVSGTVCLEIYDTIVQRPFSFQYLVSAPGISMQLDKANACYIGVENPLTVSIPGYKPQQLSLRVDDARVSQIAPGHFSIYFDKKPAENTYAFVHGTNKEGHPSIVASLPLKVRALPAPAFTIIGEQSGYISLKNLRRAEGPDAYLKYPDFDIDYDIISYKLSLLCKQSSIYIEPVTGRGNHFSGNAAVEKILNMARKGDKLIFEDIIAMDGTGRTSELASVIMKVR